MGIFDFMKDKGEPVIAADDAKAQAMEDADKSVALQTYLTKLGLPVKDLVVAFRGDAVEVHGVAATQADKEKAILAIGNAKGVARVDDRIRVEKSAPEAKFYTVQPGDSLSKIAKAEYGDASKYPAIFEANQPMLKDPDRIYPGQVLRIPAEQA